MARGINKVILVGTLGRDPEVKYMPSGGAVANLSLATSERWKDKNTGEQKEITEWHRVVMFNRLAEIAGQYLKKGQQVYIEGKLRTRKWQDQGGQDRYTTEIMADDMQMLGGGRGTEGMQAGAFEDDMPRSGGMGGGQSTMPKGGGMDSPAGNMDFDDDIPF